ncbi:MAG: glucosidase [Fimbriimonadales bacterium]
MTAEELRLQAAEREDIPWKRWGPYLSERSWGTVREDYSTNGTAWDYFPHDHARSRAYRWNEDGIAGICDQRQHICFSLALWNGKDPILKERLFGLTGSQGNHGEDVKELYYYLDSTPTHSYMRMLYKYPQGEYPYSELVAENQRRGKLDPEYELLDTGLFDENRYWDVEIEYAKADPEDILIQITAHNRGPAEATLHLLPTILFRNNWTWDDSDTHPSLYGSKGVIELDEIYLGRRRLYCEGSPELLFTENESNTKRLWGAENQTPYVKDGINDFVVNGAKNAINPKQRGTKAAARYVLTVKAGESASVRLRLTDKEFNREPPPPAPSSSGARGIAARGGGLHDPIGNAFDDHVELRRREADDFFKTVIPEDLSDDAKNVMRQAIAGLLWSKQHYHYAVEKWLDGDKAEPAPPESRKTGRNSQWTHVYASDVISMPDKWEYPWFASWDLAFHCVSLAIVDPDFAKQQLILLLREWYMHPNGQIPAYEWAFGDANPPVHAWSALRVFRIEKKRKGQGDYDFLERVFHKLLLNFTWWVNRKDAEGRHLFQGGFLGLDNIGIFDRNAELPCGGFLEQADGTAWMGFYCLNLMAMALEIAAVKPAYEDVATKFLEHFTYIGRAMTTIGGDMEMWSEQDGFFYDVLCMPWGEHRELKVRSMVGLIPMFAVDTLEPEQLTQFKGFRERMEWYIEHSPDVGQTIASMEEPGHGERRLLSIMNEQRLRAVLRWLLDESEFLSPYGIRALSKFHEEHPYSLLMDGHTYDINYEPAESTTTLFGGNSNWRGPVWFPVNYLIVESLQKFDWYFGKGFRVEFPTGSGKQMALADVAAELSRRLSRTFLQDENGSRPVHGDVGRYRSDPHWRDLVLFYEYFHGDTGRGLGASHQTGWTGLVAKLLQQSGE